jgi:hypothetical protein
MAVKTRRDGCENVTVMPDSAEGHLESEAALHASTSSGLVGCVMHPAVVDRWQKGTL